MKHVNRFIALKLSLRATNQFREDEKFEFDSKSI